MEKLEGWLQSWKLGFGECVSSAGGMCTGNSDETKTARRTGGSFHPPPFTRKKTFAIVEDTTRAMRPVRKMQSMGVGGRAMLLTQDAEAIVRSALKKHFLFSELPEKAITDALTKLTVLDVSPGTVCVRQGDEGDHFYVVEQGCLGVYVNGAEMEHTINSGDFFGDLALLYNHPRSATVFAKKQSRIWALNRNSFRQIVVDCENGAAPTISSMHENPLFAGMSDADLSTLFSLFEMSNYEEGAAVCNEGDHGDCFFLIVRGRVKLTQTHGLSGRAIALSKRPLKPGEFFGEACLLNPDAPRNASAVVTQEATLWVLRISQLPAHLTSVLSVNIRATFRARTLRSVPIFHTLPPDTIQALSTAMTEVHVDANVTVIRQGDLGDAFYIVFDGGVAVTQGDASQEEQRLLTTLIPGDFLGEVALLLDVERTANVVTTKPSVLLKLDKADFNSILSDATKRALIAHMRATQDAHDRVVLTAEDLLVGPELAQAPTSVVLLGKHRVVPEKFALKVVRRSAMVKRKVKKAFKAEKDVLKCVESHWVVHLKQQLETPNSFVLVMDLVDGCDLPDAIASLGRKVPINTAKLWGAMVLLGLDDLHEAGMVWRDLKPENILMDRHGYLMLSNFGTATALAPGARTFTVCGTPDYMAPEVILGKGQTRAVDIWSFGVFLYELLAGCTPFSNKNGPARSRMQIFEAITTIDCQFPPRFPNIARELITLLLKRMPSIRLEKSHVIKQHPFFEGVNWARLREHRVDCPFTPRRLKGSAAGPWKPMAQVID